MTGLYPKETGAWLNHNAMDADMTTWAEILRAKRGYYTGYVGKVCIYEFEVFFRYYKCFTFALFI